MDTPLAKAVEDFIHFAKIARYDLAAAEVAKITGAGADPVDVLRVFETAAAKRRDNTQEFLLRLLQIKEMRDSAKALLDLVNKGEFTRREDSRYIEAQIQRLGVSERAFALALEKLRDSGEVAVPLMLATLQDAQKKNLHWPVERALRQLGRPVLNPLLAATEMKDPQTLVVVVNTLGALGFDAALPYLSRLAKNKDTPQAVQAAVTKALATMGAAQTSELNTAQLFYQLAEKLYYEKSSIAPGAVRGLIWTWEEGKGLIRKAVPPAIFHEVMAKRCCQDVLKEDKSRSDAVSLWLAANYKLEVELPQGETNSVDAEGTPNAHYYGVMAGSGFLNPVLARALKDQNAALAVRAIDSLAEIVGQSNLPLGEQQPLLQAMGYGDRVVRFKAAAAIAASLPGKRFAGQEQVVPLLADILAQTGKPGVLVVAKTQDELNTLKEAVTKAGYANVMGGAGPEAALASAKGLAALDVLVLSRNLAGDDNKKLMPLLAQPRTVGMARLEVDAAEAAADPTKLASAIQAAIAKSGNVPLDENKAREYALRSAELLGRLAISQTQVLDLSAAQPALLAALEDSRPEIVKAVGAVLAMLNAEPIQSRLLARALDDKLTPELRISLFKSLATNAKFFGRKASADLVESLRKAAEGEKDLSIRSAAAEAHGAMALPAEQIKVLIVGQPKA
jgi:hypothetical protein